MAKCVDVLYFMRKSVFYEIFYEISVLVKLLNFFNKVSHDLTWFNTKLLISI